jgi:hypothetical protein
MCKHHVGVTIMVRLDQGHLHPLLEPQRQKCHGRGANFRPPAPQVSEYSSKELISQLLMRLYGTSTVLQIKYIHLYCIYFKYLLYNAVLWLGNVGIVLKSIRVRIMARFR